MLSKRRRVGRAVVAGVLAMIGVAAPSVASAQKLVIVARHAERADGGSMASGSQTDPPLSDAGEARAQKLAAMLADAGVTAVITTEYKRTQDTARPLASKLGLAAKTIAARDMAGLVNMLKSTHAQDVVFVVGHSNTVPAIIKALGGPDVSLPESDYDSLFVVVPATGATTRIRY
jgi:broad specificity phosphatase PhoE